MIWKSIRTWFSDQIAVVGSSSTGLSSTPQCCRQLRADRNRAKDSILLIMGLEAFWLAVEDLEFRLGSLQGTQWGLPAISDIFAVPEIQYVTVPCCRINDWKPWTKKQHPQQPVVKITSPHTPESEQVQPTFHPTQGRSSFSDIPELEGPGDLNEIEVWGLGFSGFGFKICSWPFFRRWFPPMSRLQQSTNLGEPSRGSNANMNHLARNLERTGLDTAFCSNPFCGMSRRLS